MAPTPGIQSSFSALGGRELDKKIARVAEIRWLKKIFPGLPGEDVPSWNWLRH